MSYILALNQLVYLKQPLFLPFIFSDKNRLPKLSLKINKKLNLFSYFYL